MPHAVAFILDGQEQKGYNPPLLGRLKAASIRQRILDVYEAKNRVVAAIRTFSHEYQALSGR
jgi:hypothetical protein